jgi:quinol monooxygenase YgiN
VLEIWEDEPSLFAHFGGDAFKGFMAKAGDVVDPMGFHALKGDLDAYALPI